MTYWTDDRALDMEQRFLDAQQQRAKVKMMSTEGMFGVPKEVIPADLYDMLVRAKTRDFQQPPPALPPSQRRRYWVVDRIVEIRGYSREAAENYYDRYVCDWLEA